jgi:hypothetical protein
MRDPSCGTRATAPTLNGQTFTGGIVPYLAQDARFTLDRLAVLNQADPNGILTGRLDLRRASILGISLGGIVGTETCRGEPRPPPEGPAGGTAGWPAAQYPEVRFESRQSISAH